MKWYAHSKRAEPKRVYVVGGTEVWAGPIEDWYELPEIPHLIVDLKGKEWRKVVTAPSFPQLEVDLRPRVVQVDWPDMGVVPLPRSWWERLAETLKEFPLVYIGCAAGKGRTGTALAILAHLHGVVPEGEGPIAWVRKVYHPEAVETQGQRAYVARITDVGEELGVGRDPLSEEPLSLLPDRFRAFLSGGSSPRPLEEPFPPFEGSFPEETEEEEEAEEEAGIAPGPRRVWSRLRETLDRLGLEAFIEGNLLVVEGAQDFLTIREVTPYLWEVEGKLMTPEEASRALEGMK